VPVPPPSDEARQADALALVARLPAGEVEQGGWRTRTQRTLAPVLLGLALVATIGVVAALVAGSAASEAPVPHWQWVTGAVVSATALVLGLVAVVVSVPANRRLEAMDAALAPLSAHRRRRLRAMARGRAAVHADDLALARAEAGMLVLRPGSLLYLGGLGLFWTGAWMRGPGIVTGVLVATFDVVWLVMGGHHARDARRAARFLDAHPQGEQPEG
jgi:hypothetical protein